jgi:cyclophilin family peptidyl-prolyl cis-trans isomerase
MPRSRRFRKSQNQVKREWGKDNPQAKVKNRKAKIILGIIAIAVIVTAAFLVVEQPYLFPAPSPTPTPDPNASPTPSPTPSPSYVPLNFPPEEYNPNGTIVQFTVHWTDANSTDHLGNVTIQMREDKPITTTNFVNLVSQGFYTGTVFHRLVVDFMIQGGKNNSAPAVTAIADEIGNDNDNYYGTISMAKTSSPNSATSEFFINVKDNSQITYDDGSTFDGTYTVFGSVIGGMDNVMAISQLPVTTNSQSGENSQPTSVISIVSARILQ